MNNSDPSFTPKSGKSDGRARVVEVEVLSPEEYRTGKRADGRNQERSNRNSGYSQRVRAYSTDRDGCLPVAITASLFLVCLGQYGLLAAIGFAVFHLMGNIAVGVRQTRQLIRGLPFNPWPWRLCNWFVSLLLTVWLAAG